MDTQTFPQVDPDKWERIKNAVLAKTGIVIGQDVGSATAKGITLSWVYDPNTQMLSVTIVKASWYDPAEDKIAARIAAAVNTA